MKIPHLRGSRGAALVLLCGFLAWSGSQPAVAPLAAASSPTAVATPKPDGGAILAGAPVGTAPAAAMVSESPMEKFAEWTSRYLAAPANRRPALLAQGHELAAARRVAMARLIRTDPRLALEQAVPMVVRQQMPAEILGLLEERVAGRGELALNAVTPLPGAATPAEPTFRTALIDGQEYRAHVFGRRDVPATVQSTSVNGIALDGHLAVAESPLRILEKGEVAADRPLDTVCGISGNESPAAADTPLNTAAGGATAVEYNGVVHLLCGSNHLAAIQARLQATEESQATTNAAAGGPGSSDVQGRPSYAWTHGAKKLLVIRVDFPDRPGTPQDVSGSQMTEPYVAGVVGQVQGFYAANSFGQTALQLAPVVNGDSPDITPVLRMPQPSTYYASSSNDRSGQLHVDAENAATAAGIDLNSYDRVGVAFSYLSSYWWAGLGNITGRNFWINGYWQFRIVAHELGHTYGLMHANWWHSSDGSNPVSTNGTSEEYGDATDVMGNGSSTAHHFSHWNKSILQWIPDAAVTTVTTSGTYRIYQLDDSTTDLSLPHALKIKDDATRDYWIGYRANLPVGNLANSAYVLWGYHSNLQGNLLNVSQSTSGTSYDSPLPVGQSFTDRSAALTMRAVATGGSGHERWIDVAVDFLPHINWSQSSDYVAGEQEGPVTLRLVRSGDASAAVSVSYATSDIPAPNTSAQAGLDYTAQSGTVAWAAGDASDKFITIPITSDTISEGGERFNVTLSNASGAVIAANPVAAVNIIDRDVRDFSFPPLDVFGWVRKAVVLPDGNMLLGGSFQDARDSGGDFYKANGLAKVTNDGRYLPAFSAPVSGAEGVVYDLETQADGKIIVAGSFSAVAGAGHSNIARLLPDGTVDGSFNASGNGTVFSIVVQADGKILLGGTFTQISGAPRVYLARLNADGSVDPNFVPPAFDPAQNGSVRALTIQPDARILVGGTFSLISGQTIYSNLCRVLSDGSIDHTFNPDGSGPGGRVRALALLSNGRIMVGGEFNYFGNQPRNGLARITASGALDPIFTVGVDGRCTALLPLADGRLVIGGTFTHINGIADDSVAILLPDDSVDTYFAGIGGFQGGEVSDILMLPNGRIQFCGSYQPFQYNQTWSPVWRFMSGVVRPPGSVQFTAATAQGDEGGTVTVTANRLGGSGAISVSYATADDSATAADYSPASGTLTWADGDTSPRTITVALNSDSVAEADETFFLNLGSPLWGGANLGAVQRQVVTIHSTNNPPPPPPPPPPGTWQDNEVGATGAAGSSSESGGTVTVTGSGADIAGTADAFHFRAQQLTGDGTIVARVASAGNTHVWAKAGIMFREDLTAGSREVINFVTPGGHSTVMYRLTPGGPTDLAPDTWWGAPVWLKLVRTGDTFTAYHSGDGSSWQQIGTVTCVMPATIYAGLAVSSHDSTVANTATFDNVSILGTTPPPPPSPPAAPTSLQSTNYTQSTVTLSWTDNADTETGFSIERAPASTANFAVVGGVAANITSFTDAGLTANTGYAYRVRAARDGVYSGYSNTASVTTLVQPPGGGWSGQDIGAIGQTGSQDVSGSTITVHASGSDIWDRSDGFRFVYQPWRGDGEIKARITRLDNTNPWAKAGVMIRESLAAGSRHAVALLTADNVSGFATRPVTDGDSTFASGPWVNAPYWVRLVRNGNTFTASVSPDGATWTNTGTQTIAMSTDVYIGLAVSSHNNGALTTAVFEQVTLPNTPPPPPPPPPPTTWSQTAWAASGNFTSSGTSLSIDTTGADLWNQFDAGLFVSQAWHGDGEIIARIDSLTNTNPWAKAGLMFRQTADATSPNVCVALTPTNGAIYQARTTTSGVTNEVQHSWLPGAPCWLKLTRTGNTFTAAFSIDGTSWTSLGSQTVVMPADLLVGFAASSHASASIHAAISGISVH